MSLSHTCCLSLSYSLSISLTRRCLSHSLSLSLVIVYLTRCLSLVVSPSLPRFPHSLSLSPTVIPRTRSPIPPPLTPSFSHKCNNCPSHSSSLSHGVSQHFFFSLLLPLTRCLSALLLLSLTPSCFSRTHPERLSFYSHFHLSHTLSCVLCASVIRSLL